jgi:hypothetical protein
MTFNGNDPWIWTPSAIGGELNRILGVFDTVNSEMSAASTAGKVSSAEWNQWYSIYLSAHSFLTTASTLWGSNVASARLQEQEAGKWRSLIASRGQALQGPTNLVRTDSSAGGVSYWSLALYGGGAVAAYLGYLYLRKRVLTPKLSGAANKRQRRLNLGSPPSAHVKRIRRLIFDVTHNAEQAESLAKAGKCALAMFHFEDAIYRKGELVAHMDSVGKHAYAVRKAVSTKAARAQIAARKALETHCGRLK